MRKLSCIVVALVLLAASSALASSNVTNIELTWQNGQTVARIDVAGGVKFSHQTEVAKDGKPFRVIVDVLTARHDLGAKKFLELPVCPVQAIRTSQYAVQPEEVVRVVFDMNKETAYQVTSDQNSVTVSFPDKAGKQFAAWSTAAVAAQQAKESPGVTVASMDPTKPAEPTAAPPVKSKSAADVNAAIDSDRMASLGSSPSSATVKKPEPTKPAAAPKPTEQPTVEKPQVAVTPSPSKQPEAKTEKPTAVTPSAQFSEKGKWAEHQEKPEPATPAAKVDATPTKQLPAQQEKPAEQPKPANKPAVKAAAEPTATTMAKVQMTQKPSQSSGDVVTKVDRPKDKTEGEVKPPDRPAETIEPSIEPEEKTDESDDAELATTSDDSDKKSTARFRRTPEQSRKIKGTMVAEFPQRLVVKYKARAYRDPFETLINETQVSNDPIEQRIPNVEGLRLVGILESEGGQNRALLEDPNGYGYILQNGDRVTKGYVLRIESDKVYFQIFEYGWSRTIALHIED